MINGIVEKPKFIEEELYKKIKKEMNKRDDFYTYKELEKFMKSDVILT